MDQRKTCHEDPEVHMEEVLCGHEHSGVYWQGQCDVNCRKADFEIVAKDWATVYYEDPFPKLAI